MSRVQRPGSVLATKRGSVYYRADHWNELVVEIADETKADDRTIDIEQYKISTIYSHKMFSQTCRSLVHRSAGSNSSLILRSMQSEVKAAPTSAKPRFTEVEIKVPWGTVAGKLWNPNKSQPILALHGWLDNAGSFDKLVPLLSEDISVLAIDLPGHGRSSWLPDGIIYTKEMYIHTIDRIKSHFRWDKIGFLGHSLGAMFAFSYNVWFPENVKFTVAFDYYKFTVSNIDNRIRNTSREFVNLLKFEKSQSPPPGCTEADMIEKMIKGSGESLDESSSRILMERGVTIKNGAFHLSRDPKVRFLNLVNTSFCHETLKEEARFIKSPYMILKGEQCGYGEDKKNYYEVLRIMEKSSQDLQFFMVPGKHHLHMTNPQGVAQLLTPFLEKYN